MARRNFSYDEFWQRCLMFIALKLSESFLLELTQRNLSRKYFDVDSKKLVTLLDNILYNLMMIQGHEQMQSAVAAICQNDSSLNILNTLNERWVKER